MEIKIEFKDQFILDLSEKMSLCEKNNEIDLNFRRFSRIDKYPIFEFNISTNLDLDKSKFKMGEDFYDIKEISLVKALEDQLGAFTRINVEKEISDIVLKSFGVTEDELQDKDKLQAFKRELQLKLLNG